MKKINKSENKNTIILFSEKPILNPSEVKEYPKLSANYSIFLNTLLYSNWIEILSELKEKFEIIYFLSISDKDYLPRYFLSEDTNVIFYDPIKMVNFSDYLLKHALNNNSKTIILFSNSIGLSKKDFNRIFNLLQSDEPSVVIGKSDRDKIIFVCVTGVDKELIDPLLKFNREFSRYLNAISSKDIFINTLDNFLSINDFEDFKKLYIELSKKESLSYCSKKMHESFNDLFIEYKDLLNV